MSLSAQLLSQLKTFTNMQELPTATSDEEEIKNLDLLTSIIRNIRIHDSAICTNITESKEYLLRKRNSVN